MNNNNNNDNDSSELDTVDTTEDTIEEHIDSQPEFDSLPMNNNDSSGHQLSETTFEPVRDPNFLFNFFSTPPKKVIIAWIVCIIY